MSDESAAESGRTALRVAAVVLLVLVVAPFVVTGVPSIVGAEESFVVLSGSMNDEPEPIIRPGDVVIVDGVDSATIEEQDIITFTAGGEEPVTHRVVNVTEQNGQVAFRTKGDANEDADPQLVGPDQIIGEVIFVIPLVGHVVNFANTTGGFVLLVLLPVGLLVLSEVWNLVASSGGSSDEGDEPGTRHDPAVGATHADESDLDETGDDDGPATVSLGKTQVGWTAVGLVPVAAAAGYAAFRLQTAWVLTVFFASIGLCLLSGLLYLRMHWGVPVETGPGPTRRADEAARGQGQDQRRGRIPPVAPDGEAESESALPTAVQPVVEDGIRRDPVVTGRIESTVDDGSYVEVTVDSREQLVRMAIEKSTWVVHDPETEAYVLVDAGMLFRYENGTSEPERTTTEDESASDGAAVMEASSDWEGTSDWITFPDDEDDERARPQNGAGDAGIEADAGGEPKRAIRRVSDGNATDGTAGSPASNRERPAPVRSGEDDPTPAIRRIDDTIEDTAGDHAVDPDGPARSNGMERSADDSVKTDGGTATDLPPITRAVGRLVDVPIRALGFVGYLVVEPPTALYRAVRSSGGGVETGPQSGERSAETEGDR